ncbi:M48 family metalloprotease [Dysgonomonas sp. Marseille-P4677]|uniref:M48 family metalloprotease n=1 Tax=Dysgonomonas sp. Marseille-P4677 TaxID=2364790 RepID=UPI0019114E17|nr:M48 family metalloprotease [Dysgonomonas sp. Marseille-P4677]MBK5721452.1 M48 family metalloprotease [Dysgonomonas sp. Marseille-P4677]
MIKKTFFLFFVFAILFTVPANAQFKNLGKALEKAVDGAVNKVTKKATDMATGAALELSVNKVSDQLIKFLDNSNKITGSNDAYTLRLKDVLGDNFKMLENKNLDIKIYNTTEANIITLNNGSIRIYSGMMDILTDFEIQALIALQVGHIKTGNIRNNLLKVVSGNNLDEMTEAQLGKILSFSGDKIKTISNELLLLPYTRDQNKSADNYAKKYLKKNEGNNDAYSQLLSKIRKLAQIDLESNSLDAGDKTVIQAGTASSFIKMNSLR